MITSVDSSILIDIGTRDKRFAEKSLNALKTVRSEGRLVVCPVVWAEVCALYDSTSEFSMLMQEVGIDFDPFDVECSSEAGRLWRLYRKGGGKRGRLLSDFIIGAHASVKADRLLTRDRGFNRRYFDGLTIVEP